MGMLVEGNWKDAWYDTKSTGGKFVRSDAGFRHWVTPTGDAGPSGEGGFVAEPGRYHLYVSYACPWAHRTLIFRKLKGLEDKIDLSVVHFDMFDQGWTFEEGPKVEPDTVLGSQFMHQVYTAAKPTYTGRVTVPVLWDKKTETIVSNESSEIIRMFNSAFDELDGVERRDFYPDREHDEIAKVNERVYHHVNNGVYKSGFATTQEAYEEAVDNLFDTMDWLDERLGAQRYLVGNQITEADWRLFTTLVRFDPVYVGHFKCNRKRLVDYPNLWNYTKELYQYPGVAETVHMDHIKGHYYRSHTSINPHRVVPTGPELDYTQAHDRARLS